MGNLARLLSLRPSAIGIIALSIVFVTLALAPLLSSPGVPAYEQDWQWPVASSQCTAYAHLGSQPWNSGGIGSAQSYPEPWLPYAVAGSLCSVAGPHTGLVLYLVFLFALAALGINWLTKNSGFATAPRACALACYLGNPVLLNKLHAGHLHFLVSYALLPFFLAALLDNRSRWAPLLLGALWGLASAQQQFFFFGLFLGIFLTWRYGLQWLLRSGLPALAVALCFTAPQWVLSIVDPASAANFATFRPLLHWEESQSIPLAEAARFLGYIGGYDAALPYGLRILLWIFPLLALIGFLFAMIQRTGRIWGIVAICALLLATGLLGPLAPVLTYLITHSNVVAALREFYNAQALGVISYAMLSAIAVQSLQFRTPLRYVAIVSSALIILCCGWVAWYVSRDLPSYSISPKGISALQQIADAPGTERYLPIPSAQPQSIHGSNVTGLSPFALPVGTHASALDSSSETPYSLAVAAQSPSGGVPEHLLRSLAVSYMLTVPGIDQTSSYEPQLRSVFPLLARARHSEWEVRKTKAQRIAFLEPDTLIEVTAGGTQVDLNAIVQDVNPRKGWARTALWSNLPEWIYEQPAGIFTVATTPQLFLPGRSTIVAGSAGPVKVSGCRRTGFLDVHYAVFDCAGEVLFKGAVPIVVSQALTGGRIIFSRTHPTHASTERLTVLEDRVWKADISLEAPAGAVIVLRERFDPAWACLGCDALHARAAGFANAWILRDATKGRITIVYRWAYLYYAALLLSVGILIAALLQVTLICVRQRREFHRS